MKVASSRARFWCHGSCYGLCIAGWTFLTNHAHVLVCLARDPEARFRDVAEAVGITERAAQRIVADLVEAGYVIRTREGRRNHYVVRPNLALRHPLEHDHEIGELLGALGAPTGEAVGA